MSVGEKISDFVSGWRRWRREHYRVWTGPLGGSLVQIPAPCGSYYADPFPLVHDGEPWLLLEEFRYARNCGRLIARRAPGGPVVPLPLATHGHASFPCVFRDRGRVYLLPETGAAGTLDLYVCEKFPLRWRHVRRLARDLDAVDTVPVFQAGGWWLFTFLRDHPADRGRRRLAIFSTDDLECGELRPHPVNAESRYGASPHSFGRSAGPFHRAADGNLYRPIQANRRYYGEALAWRRIDALTPDAFRETETAPPPDLPAPPAPRLHHLAALDGWIACDTRDRTPAS